MWTDGQGKTKRGRNIEDENNEEISKIEIEREECSIRVLNRGKEGREERCLRSTRRADKEPIWNSRKQKRG